MIKATCPNNPEHDWFRTWVYEQHEVLVDDKGEIIRELDFLESEEPDASHTWFCYHCGAVAMVEETTGAYEG